MLKSTLLSGNARLEQASNGPPAIRKRPPDDDADAVRRIQKALSAFGFKLPKSFPNGAQLEPDGIFGSETEGAVRTFQKQAFPGKMSEWDGRCGPKTLAAMDARLGSPKPAKSVYIPPRKEVAVCKCYRGNANSKRPGRAVPPGVPVPYPNVGMAKPGAASRKLPGMRKFSNITLKRGS